MITALMQIPTKLPLVTEPVAIFLVVLGLILVVPMLLQRLKIPHVIGLIVAGAIVGPTWPNISKLISRESTLRP